MPDLTAKQTDDILVEARKNRDKAYTFSRQNDSEAREDLKFVAGEQWYEQDLDERRTDGRPALTINQMPQFIRQVTGDIRLNRPSIKIRPVDNGADIKIAKILTGLIRNIEYQSRALRAYVNGAESAARCGIGHWRIVTEFSDDSSFNQDIRIDGIKSPFAVSWDPSAEKDDRSDAMWCFVTSEVDIDSFKQQWPKASTSGWDKKDIDYDVTLWRTRDTVTVAEYWRKERDTKTLALMDTGETLDITNLPKENVAILPITRQRTVESHKVVQYMITDSEVLEGPFEWIGKDIPIIPVLGEEVHVGDRTVRHGMIRFAKDSQRQYNYWQTSATETMALAPKSPYLATEDQIGDYRSMWDSANRKNYAVLMYKHDPVLPGPPQRNPPPDLPVAAATMMQTAKFDMNSTTGIYPPSLGAQGNETSGKAISLRQSEGDVGTYVYIENTAFAIETTGRQLVDIIPKVYDGERIVRIVAEDDTDAPVLINQNLGETDDDGNPILTNDITIGRYDVVVTTGPSFSSKRQESQESMSRLIEVFPQLMTVAGDLMVKAMDWPGADLIAERMESLQQPSPPDPKDQADTAKSMADAAKKQAETEGQQIENLQAQFDLALQTGALQQLLAPIVAEQVQLALGAPQGALTP